MRFSRRLRFVAMALSAVTVFAIPVSAAPLPIQASATPNTAAAGNTGDAFIYVFLANEDGTPNTKAEIPKQGQDPNGGVELKGSKWSFETLFVPNSYRGRAWADAGQTRQTDVIGQLRIVQVNPYFNREPAGDPRAGLYVFRVLPRYGFKGGRKAILPWVPGQYMFRISYKDGSNQGTALGVLTIR